MEKEDFLKLLPKFIRESDEVKGAIITALLCVVATKNDITRVIEHSDKRFKALINQINIGFKAAHRERSMITARLDSFTGRSGKSLENTILYLLND